MFVFDKRSVERLHKPKRKDQITELLKVGLGHLQCYRHPRLLQILHGPDDSPEALAFVSEPVIGSLANILRYGLRLSWPVAGLRPRFISGDRISICSNPVLVSTANIGSGLGS